MVDDCGLSALHIAAFYGHMNCVHALLDYPIVESDEGTIQGDGDQDGESKPFPTQSTSSSLASICPVDALRRVFMQWHFKADGSNCLVIGPSQRNVSASNVNASHLLEASFNVLHLAIMTA